jgi:hypothetical protein
MARIAAINVAVMLLALLLLSAHWVPAVEAQSGSRQGTTVRAGNSAQPVRTSGNRGQMQRVKRKPAVKNQKGQ